MLMNELIKPEDVLLDFDAKTKDEAMEMLANILYTHHKIDDLQGFLKDIYEREAITSTGIGFGIAIPHAKSSHVLIPTVIFARSIEGIPFDAMDGKDAHLFFMIAMPEDGTNAHLRVLAMLSRKLMHEDFREALFDVQSLDEALKLLHTMN
ncbi:MAG: fructose PTS transporter subunit IIA [Acholeplasmataceae bacterium]|jgi:fructose-specific phosphotransferase system IIA component|nr:fructose PTS transporter subunit IIA [Acholeplasmataceae bacterium]